MTREIGAGLGTVRLVVPGTWIGVPLGSPQEAEAFVKRLVRKQVGSADRLARARREATQEIMANVVDAVSGGCHTYLMSLELLPGVPFPAALLLFDEPWPEAARAGLGADDVDRALREAYPAGEVAEQRNGPVARLHEMTKGVTESGEQLVTMRLEYHIPYPDRSRLLLARVNVPNIPSAEPFATLFDEILDSVTFLAPDRAAPRPAIARQGPGAPGSGGDS